MQRIQKYSGSRNAEDLGKENIQEYRISRNTKYRGIQGLQRIQEYTILGNTQYPVILIIQEYRGSKNEDNPEIIYMQNKNLFCANSVSIFILWFEISFSFLGLN